MTSASFAATGPAGAALCPLALEGLQVEETGTEIVVFDPVGKQFHLLNKVAHYILTRCNGVATPKEIAIALSLAFDLEGRSLTHVTNDVIGALDQLQQKGLVAFIADVANAPLLASAAATSLGTDGPLFAVAAQGTSMFPILMSGDRIVVKRVSSLDLVVGDIVVYARADDALIAHRVMSIDQLPVASVVTKGDTATEADAPVSFERVIGKATAVLRDGGVLWIRAIDWRGHDLNSVASAIPAVAATAAAAAVQPARFNFSRSKVLDLRDMSAESIRNIGSVEDVSVVLLSPRTADAWSNVVTRGVKSILTVPDDYRVYTGQPELLPEMLDFMPGPIRLVVSGQLFLTQFDAEQIRRSIASLILSGQAYVSSGPAQTALAAVTTIIAGDIEIVPAEHARWIGESIVGPEYMASQPGVPLVVVGECATSPRMNTAAMPLVFTCAAAGEPLA